MKNLLLYFFTFTLFITFSFSCKDNDEPEENTIKEILESARYDHLTMSFTLTYQGGQTETVSATIDNTITPPSGSATLADGTTIYVTDASVSGIAAFSKDNRVVPQFIYDGMSNFYLWADEVKNKKPTTADYKNPAKYFYRLLNATDTKHGWSWITNDISTLLSGFEGEETDAFGFQPLPLYLDESETAIIGFIRYVYPGTPAEAAALKRGEVITKINGQSININNYMSMYGANTPTTFTVLDQNFENPREVLIVPARTINTDPVLYSNVYEIEGHKIGYLFYTNFYSNYNESLYNAFSEFKSAGITDLVLDLRYNPGGGVDAAIYLASLIAPESAVRTKEVFTTMSYNKFLNEAIDGRSFSLGEYDNRKYPNPLTANPGLDKVHIITTSSSASASELLTFCLKPYISVVQIGEKTSGKYTASWTIHPYNDYGGSVQPVYVESSIRSAEKKILKDWGMQPIVGRYTDKDGADFIATDGLIPTHIIEETNRNERNTETWKPIGDVDDYLFSKAIALITASPQSLSVRSFKDTPFKETGLYSPIEEVFRRGVIINPPGITLGE